MTEHVAHARTAKLRSQIQALTSVAIVVAAFVVSRCWYRAKGLRFDTSPIDYFAQMLDRTLLRDRLAESLFYLHSQPPLYNLLTGVALKLAPDKPELVLSPVFLAAGLYSALCLYFVMGRLRVPSLVAAAVAAIIVATPAFVLYENWYFYPHLDVAWLLGAIAWAAQSRARPNASMVVAATHLVGLSLTRSLFHPMFFGLAALVTVALVAAGARRRTAACFAAPGLLLFAWCLKNLLIFGFFGTSSWASRNISQSVVDLLGANRVAAEARLAQLSPATTLRPFDTGERNMAAFALPERVTGVPALDNTRKQASVLPINYNHWSYPASARYYAADTRHLLTSYPVTYLRGIAEKSVRIYFNPVDGDGFVAPNRAKIADATRAWDDFDQSTRSHWLLGGGLVLAALWTLTAERDKRLVLGLAFLAILWVTFVGIFGDYGENYRFRYKALWLSWAIAVAGCFALLRAAKQVLEGALRGRP